jgi:hypothetical protein
MASENFYQMRQQKNDDDEGIFIQGHSPARQTTDK